MHRRKKHYINYIKGKNETDGLTEERFDQLKELGFQRFAFPEAEKKSGFVKPIEIKRKDDKLLICSQVQSNSHLAETQEDIPMRQDNIEVPKFDGREKKDPQVETISSNTTCHREEITPYMGPDVSLFYNNNGSGRNSSVTKKQQLESGTQTEAFLRTNLSAAQIRETALRSAAFALRHYENRRLTQANHLQASQFAMPTFYRSPFDIYRRPRMNLMLPNTLGSEAGNNIPVYKNA